MPVRVWKYEVRITRIIAAACCYVALICLHEAGHWLTAELVSFHAPVFKIGHGEPHLVLFRIFNTDFQLCPLLIGGSVHVNELIGFQTSSEILLKRILVLTAGPLTNLLCAFALGFAIVIGNVVDRVNRSAILVKQLFVEILQSLLALLLFRHQKYDHSTWQYYSFLEIPFEAVRSCSMLLSVLFSTALSEAVFNILPIPGLDGGNILFDVLSLTQHPASDETQILSAVLSRLFLAVIFFAAIYRNFRWPVPKSSP